MPRYPGLKPDPKSGIFYYRRVIPKPLREAFGQSAVNVSLKTRDLREAIPPYLKHAADVEQRLREAAATTPAATSAPAAAATPAVTLTPTAADIRAQTFADDARRRVDLFKMVNDDEDAFWRGEIIPFPQTAYFNHLMQEPDFDAVLGYCLRHEVDGQHRQICRDLQLGNWGEYLDQIPAGQSEDDRLHTARRLMEARISALKSILKRASLRDHQIEPTGVPQASQDGKTNLPGSPGPYQSGASVAPSDVPMLSEAVENWVAELSPHWKPSHAYHSEATLMKFIEIVGDKLINAYSKADGRNYKSTVSSLPANAHKLKEYRDLSLKDAAAKAKEAGAKPMSAVTVNSRLQPVGACFKWLMAHHDGITNPVAGLTVKKKTHARDEWDPFTLDALNKIFATTIFTGCKSARIWWKPGDVVLRQSEKFWTPLIGLVTGMREGEILQLRVTNVKTEDGITYFDIDEDPKDDKSPDARTVKTPTSIRDVPVHPLLFELGFMDFVKFRQQNGDFRLFPGYKATITNRKRNWSDSFSKFFSRYLVRIGVKTPKTSFHSFRHNFEDFSKNAGNMDEVTDALTGHSAKGMSARYGKGRNLKLKAEAMAKIKFEDVDLSHLRAVHLERSPDSVAVADLVPAE